MGCYQNLQRQSLSSVLLKLEINLPLQQKRNRHKKCRGKNYSSLPSRHVFESDERRRKKFVSSAKKLAPLLHLLVVSGEKEAKTEDFQTHKQTLMLLQQQKKK